MLENISGVMPSAYEQITLGTALHSDQLMNARRDHPDLRDVSYYVPDGMIYFREGRRVKLAVTREPENLLLQGDLWERFWRITGLDYSFSPRPKEARKSIEAKSTEVFDLTLMRLSGPLGPFDAKCSLAIPTSYDGYTRLNSEEYRLAERLYGSGPSFLKNMDMLARAGISKTEIIISHPEYIKRKCADYPIVKGALLFPFKDFKSNFIASASGFDKQMCWRGERKIVAPKNLVQRMGDYFLGESIQ